MTITSDGLECSICKREGKLVWIITQKLILADELVEGSVKHYCNEKEKQLLNQEKFSSHELVIT